jgi:hypothetical protein
MASKTRKQTNSLMMYDGGRLCALMEILPSQLMVIDIKRGVQKLLTLKKKIVFLAKFSFFSFFSPLCNSLTAVEFHNLAKFHQKKNH